MKSAILVLGVWLAGVPSLVAAACCAPEAAKLTSCGGCGESESQRACCVSNVAPADTPAELPSGPEAVPQVVEEAPLAALTAYANRSLAEEVERPSDIPLYLRHRTLLI
jgi:hypothetical protein